MKTIILDTNFLLIPGQFKVDIFSEINRIMHEPYELCIIEGTVFELENIIKEAKGTDKRAARLALQLIEHNKLRPLKIEKNLNIDKLIEELVNSSDYIVATQDMALKRKLKQKNVQLFVLRQKKHLALI